MTQLFSELTNIAIPMAGGVFILLYPMWKMRDISRRFVIIYLIGWTCYLCAALLIVRRFMEIDIQTVQIIKLVVMPPGNIMPFIVFRKRMWQNIFLNAVGMTIALVWIGMGMFVGENRFASNALFAANIVSLAVAAVTLPPLLIMLRRLCANPDMKQAVTFWRLAWIVPAAFFAIMMFASSYFGGGSFSGGFIAVRVLVYAVLLCICYLFEVAVRQISQAEAAKRAAEEHEKKAEFYRRMAHKLLTPLTKVSTSIQVANKDPGRAAELLPLSQAEIMAMAEKINEALDDSEGGAGA